MTEIAPRGRTVVASAVPVRGRARRRSRCRWRRRPPASDPRPRLRDAGRSAPYATGPMRAASSQACTASHRICAASSRWSTRPETSTMVSSAQAFAVSAKTLGKTTTSTDPCRSSRVATSMVEPARVTTRREVWMMPPRVTCWLVRFLRQVAGVGGHVLRQLVGNVAQRMLGQQGRQLLLPAIVRGASSLQQVGRTVGCGPMEHLVGGRGEQVEQRLTRPPRRAVACPGLQGVVQPRSHRATQARPWHRP